MFRFASKTARFDVSVFRGTSEVRILSQRVNNSDPWGKVPDASGARD